ncbi:MAG: hypothetical protein U9R40_02505, partial [Synergistota bacterium]|nr:hypothetical protein [Synergistota bacterium]
DFAEKIEDEGYLYFPKSDRSRERTAWKCFFKPAAYLMTGAKCRFMTDAGRGLFPVLGRNLWRWIFFCQYFSVDVARVEPIT